MPHAIGTATPLANIGSNGWTELVPPTTNGFVSHVDSSFRKQVLNVSQAQRETKIEPHGLADYVGMKAMPLERNGLHSLLFSNEFLQLGDELSLD